MADFDLTQTDAQVQSILNDAQDAQGAGAQTTLTTDYIMLKGTNGRYHKILKDSFTEAVRNVLAGLLVNNDKGTTISQIPAIASGDFGSVTPANLASVLGGQPFVSDGSGTGFSGNLDSITYESTLWFADYQNVQNLPSDWTGYGAVKVSRIGSRVLVMKLFRTDGSNEYTRVKWMGNNWESWHKITYGT